MGTIINLTKGKNMKSFKYKLLDNLPTLFVALVVAFAFVMISNHAKADDMSIDMLNKRDDGAKMAYSVDVAEINSGDTITWLPTSKGHNVHFIAGPEGWDLPKKSKNNKEVSITFDTPGMYLYQCTPHASMGMIALVIVDGDTSNKDAIAKTKIRGKSKKLLKKLLADL
jgi:pseudoazurin